jgi:hypothetical protein
MTPHQEDADDDDEVVNDAAQHTQVPCPDDLRPLIKRSTVSLRARHLHNDTLYTRSSTHVGNSLIYYRPGGDPKLDLVPGSIKYIYLPQEGVVTFAVQRQLSVPDGICDPFRHYPDFPAKLYSSQLHDQLDIVQPDWVIFQFARWNMSADYAVILSLPRVCVLSHPNARR